MFKKLFRKGSKSEKSNLVVRPVEDVDEDETIVIDLSGPDHPIPENIELELPDGVEDEKPGASGASLDLPEPKPVEARELAPESSDGDETDVLRVTRSGGPVAPAKTASDQKAIGVADQVGAGDIRAGWFCIVTEAGFGRMFDITLGRNTVGRGSGNTISIDNGDTKISSEAHVTIAADPQTQKFYLVAGDSRNLAYLNGMPLLQQAEMVDGDLLQVGETKLVFVQFFGRHVDWR